MVKTRPGGVLLSGRDGRMGTETRLEMFLTPANRSARPRFAGGRSSGVSNFCSLAKPQFGPPGWGFVYRSGIRPRQVFNAAAHK